MSEVFKEGYFTEECPLWPGRALSVRIEEVLASEETDYQLLEIFRGEGFGKMLALDGKIQLAESDEFIYHEMFVHVPCFSHPEPENVLVIGGGDGGVVRELLKHSCIEHIDLCELDEEVVNQCTRFFPWTGKALNDPRVDLHFLDGSLFVKGHPASYDLVLVDGPDPIGPGETLFTKNFLADCKRALRPGGILVSQSESYLLHPAVTEEQCRTFQELFAYSGYYAFSIPSYPGGSLGFCIGCDEHRVDAPYRRPIGAFVRRLKMYSMAVHKAAFVLPPFWTKRFESDEEK